MAERAFAIDKVPTNNTAGIVGIIITEERYTRLEPEYVEVAKAFRFGACDSNSQSCRGRCLTTVRNTFNLKTQNSFQRMHPLSAQYREVRWVV